MSKLLNFVETPNGITIIFDDKSIPLVSENPLFRRVRIAVLKRDSEQVEILLDRARRLKQATEGKFWVDDGGVVNIDGKPLPNVLSERLLVLVDSGFPTDGLEAFWANVQTNPNPDSVLDLYSFLEHNGIPITLDGCFHAYKRVGENYMDLHTGKFDNTPGKVVQMDRSKCDPDRNNTCSRGLHVAAWGYASGFYGNGHLLEVKVNPRDVVAVPTDYHNEKMRTCEYTVVRVAGKPRTQPMVFSEGDAVEYVNPETQEVIEVVIEKCLDGFPHEYDVRAKDDNTGFLSVAEASLRWIGQDDFDEDEDNGWDDYDDDDDDDDDGWPDDDDDDDDDDGDWPPIPQDGGDNADAETPKSKDDDLRDIRDQAQSVVDKANNILNSEDEADDEEDGRINDMRELVQHAATYREDPSNN